MLRSACILLCLFQAVNLISGEGHYFVSAPAVIRPDFDYKVVVTADVASSIKVGIVGESFTDHKTIDVKPDESKIVNFELPSTLSKGDYTLTTEGLSGIVFKNSSNLYYQPKKYILLAETDKYVYKPGDSVKFRVFILDSHTRPVEITKKLKIEIHDSEKNLIKKYDVEHLTHGVHIDELHLSEEPVLGHWQIAFTYNEQTIQKSFKIDRYVLPKFEIKIELPHTVARQEEKIRGTVRAMYTYGKGVEGELTANLFRGSHYGYRYWDQSAPTPPITSKIVTFNEKADIEFDIPELLESEKNDYATYYYIQAILEEKFTGKKINTTGNFAVKPRNYVIRNVNAPNEFIPDEPFEVTIKLEDIYGKPKTCTEHPITLFSTVEYNPEFEPTVGTDFFDGDGVYTTKMTIAESENVTHHTIYANFRGRNEYVGTISNKNKVKDLYVPYTRPFEIKVEGYEHSVDKDLPVTVTSEKEMKYFVYQVIGRGNVLKTEYVQVPDSKEFTFTLKPTYDYIPHVQVFAYFFHDDEVIYTNSYLNFKNTFKNKIELSATEEAKPGEDATIAIDTTSNSFVGLLSVDQSVLMLGKGNQLSQYNVFSKYYEFETHVPYGPSQVTYPGHSVGLVSMTNANYKADPIMIMYDMVARDGETAPRLPAAPPGQGGEVTIRKEFPETWIWETLTTEHDGNTTITRKVPDTITSWEITGFSLNPETGIAITKDSTKLKVFQPFFVATTLPYSVKRGEIISVPVVVFNYQDKPVSAEVTFLNTHDEFDFVEESEGTDSNVARTKSVTIPANSNAGISFTIKPKKVGHITLKVTATSPLAGDGLERLLLVEPEGVTQYKNKAFLVDLGDKTEQVDEIDIEIPDDAVLDSTHVEVSVIGDILGPALYNLDKLVRLPTGCGEQNMAAFVPNILVLEYFEKTNRGTPEIIEKAKKYTETGYQRQLTYKHKDGSFSSFGESHEGPFGEPQVERTGSVWLTAYVARYFRYATKYTSVDETVIVGALEYLAKHQQENGSFADPHSYFMRRRYDVDDKAIPLTAFVVLAFLESKTEVPQYEAITNKALEYITHNVDEASDVFTIAISAYVLQVAEHSSKDSFVGFLKKRATLEHGRRWWQETPETENEPFGFWYYYSSFDIKTTGYALLTLLESETETSAELAPIVRWLTSQRNDYGGFGSTQSTVVGIEGLMHFAEKLQASKDDSVAVHFTYGDESSTLTTNHENSIVVQTHELSTTTRHVKITSTGHGSALVQVSYRYNVIVPETEPKFTVKPKLSETSNTHNLELTNCITYTPSEGESDKTGMAVMEITFPSGFTADHESFPAVKSANHQIKRVETKKGDTVVVVYFEYLDKNEICPTVEAVKTSNVADQKPASVIVYDYYDNSRSARVFYSAPASTICDICEGKGCASSCVEQPHSGEVE